MSLWNPDLASVALTAPKVDELKIAGFTGSFYEIQSRGITWLYATPRAFLADVTGTGKTLHGIGLTALLRQNGELAGKRAVFCVLAGTVGQWQEEFAKFLPEVDVVANQGLDRAERRALYRHADWEVLITSYDLMRRDADMLSALRPQLLFFDESSIFRNRATRTAEGARKLAAASQRVYCASATPIENTLGDLFSQLEVLGLAGAPDSLFGNEAQFTRRYMIQQPELIHGRGGRRISRMKTTGYRNLDELTRKLGPFYLRRTEGSDDMPEVVPEDIWVPLTPEQREVYDSLVTEYENGDRFALANLSMRLLQVTSTLATLGMEDHSSKLDWIMESLGTRYAGEKVVVFTRWIPTVVSLGRRLREAGIGHEVISGAASSAERDAARANFWNDPNCRVMILTLAGEKGINLQCARFCVTVDLLWNPSRIEQIVGRIKRSGSLHEHVFLNRLMAPGTVETGVLKSLRYKQALADRVNGDESEIFDALTEDELRTVIRGG